MDAESLLKWSEKAYTLSRKYSSRKKDYVKRFLVAIGERRPSLFSKRMPKDIIIPEFILFMQRNQIVLYSNILNYSNIAWGILRSNRSSTDSTQLQDLMQKYILLSSKMKAEIERQIMGLRANNYADVIQSLEVESRLDEEMKRDVEFMRGYIDGTVKNLIRALKTAKKSATLLNQFILENKTSIKYLEVGCMVVSAICLATGISAGSTLSDLRSIMKALG